MAPPCPPPALIRTSCGWDYALLGMGGEGRQAARVGERNQKQMVVWWGPRTGKVPTVVWAVPFRVGHSGKWSGRASVCGRTGHLGTHSSCLSSAWAEVAPRSKRRCVLERKQPYSGDEWCSGPDSEEDDKPIGAAHSEYPLVLCLMGPSKDAILREPPYLGL